MKEKLSEKQAKLLETIEKYIAKNGYSPTIRELCIMTRKKSPATIKTMLDILQVKGYITFIPNQSRTLRVIK